MKKLDYRENEYGQFYLTLDIGHYSSFCATSKYTIPNILNIEYYKFVEIVKKYHGVFTLRDTCVFEKKQDIINVIDELNAILIMIEFEK